MTLPHAVPANVPDRRVDLDWLRIAAFGLLIFYHVGMFYVTWDWHVKSGHASPAAEPLMRLLNPWRLTLLFVISGCATRFMLDKMNPGRFLASRTVRLFIPLGFCVAVIVPPQTYYEVVEKLGFAGGFGDFYSKYITASGDWAPGGETLITPTYNHFWFVAYLFIYTILIVAVGPLVTRLPASWFGWMGRGLPLIILPWLLLTAATITLRPLFGETHALIDDWYNHPVYFGAFLFGYAVAKHEAFFLSCEKMRWPLAIIAVGSWLALEILRSTLAQPVDPILSSYIGPAIREAQAWTMILALFGFARKHLRHDSPVRRYLTDAIFPFYIIHQTVIVVAGYHLNQLGMPVWLEAPLVIAITVGACWLGYEILRHVGVLRPLFGLKIERMRKQPKSAIANA